MAFFFEWLASTCPAIHTQPFSMVFCGIMHVGLFISFDNMIALFQPKQEDYRLPITMPTFSSKFIFVPPYSGSKTLSPTLTLTSILWLF